jgi:hypothetical protein
MKKENLLLLEKKIGSSIRFLQQEAEKIPEVTEELERVVDILQHLEEAQAVVVAWKKDLNFTQKNI